MVHVGSRKDMEQSHWWSAKRVCSPTHVAVEKVPAVQVTEGLEAV
jgi:hypothetical protein